jgi:glutamate-1-semialdehyde 2,1-aminomutase
MGAMHEFLRRLDTPEIAALYANLDETWNARAAELNRRLAAQALPIRVVNMSTVWTIVYKRPSRYNWMFQYYLRREGLALSWVGTGRLIFSLNYTAADFEEVARRFVAAAETMARDGWWWQADAVSARQKAIRRQILNELVFHGASRLIRVRRSPAA